MEKAFLTLHSMIHLNKMHILLLMSPVGENINTSLCFVMIFSDAQPVQFWPIECNTYNQAEPYGVHHKCFCQPWQCSDEIKIQFTETSDSSPEIADDFSLSVRDEDDNELLNLPFEVYDTGTKFVYSLSLVPSDMSPDLCDQRVQFVILNDSAEAVAQSDCQDIQTEQTDTILINYRNHRNVFGLIYADISPEVDFNLRVPAIFFHQRFPKEEETILLSTSMVSANSVVRRQRLLDVDYVPYYFHEKLNLILQHQFVNIYSREWVTQEAYEIVEGNRQWPVKKGKIYLSEKEFVMRNVL
jgi:hypothetical protein